MPKQYFTEKEIENAMNDQAVTNLSGWTLNDDSIDDGNEEEYRQRLNANADILNQKLNEAIQSIGK